MKDRFKEILKQYKKIIFDFQEGKRGVFSFIFPFCDKEMIVDERDLYKILALNIFFEFFNCTDEKKISFNDFYELLKFDIKNDYYIFEYLVNNEKKTQKEKKEIILKYLEYYKEKKPIFFLINKIKMFEGENND